MGEYRENALSYENGGKVDGKQSENKEMYSIRTHDNATDIPS
jgi:hypothetical protein